MTLAAQFAVILLCIAVILLAIGLGYQVTREARDRRRYPPPGERLDLGGFHLHYSCNGEGTPTVVMDAGGSAPAIAWGIVPSEIAKFTRVFTYDRAGLGWSEPNPKQPRTSQQSVDELHLLLNTAGIQPPYILVGHSLGGVNMRLYASQYPSDVLGLVLVDSSHEHQITPKMQRQLKLLSWLYQILRVLSLFGALRLVGEMNLLPILKNIKQDSQTYPLDVQALFDTFKSFCYRPSYWATASNELTHINQSLKAVEAVTSLGSLPLIVLSQGAKDPQVSDERFQQWQSLQLDLVKLSSNSQRIIAETSGHNIQLDQPELIVNAVQELITGL